jgi:4-hydroxy-2-oxoheptanedioate aldolase
VWLESEHIPNNREILAWAMQCYAAYGVAPLLRIPEISPARAAMAVDAGAHGIIVPYVETVEQVKAMIGAIKYRPLKGRALHDHLNGVSRLDDETVAYLENYNHDAVLVIMIESPTGLENLPDMLQLGGVDAVLIGPHDLSVSLQIPEQYQHPRFVEAVDAITAICKQHGVGVGMHYASSDDQVTLAWCRRGANLISYRSDTLLVAHGVQQGLAYLRQHLDSSDVRTP